VIVGTAAQGPMKAALGLADWRIVDAGETAAHQAVFAKLPILVPVGSEPISAIIAPFVREARLRDEWEGHAEGRTLYFGW